MSNIEISQHRAVAQIVLANLCSFVQSELEIVVLERGIWFYKL